MYNSILQGDINKNVRHRNFPSHKHYTDELYVCFSGSATDITEKEKRSVSAGDVYIREKGITHRQTDVSEFYCAVFQFDRDVLLSRIPFNDSLNMLFSEKSHLFIDANTVRYVEIIADIMKNESDIEVSDMMFLSLLDIIFKKSKPRTEKDSYALREDVEEIVRYIEHNYDKAITLSSLARRSNYSVRHFTRLFREAYNKSPMEYLNDVRIKNASDLLVRSDMSIIEISRLCGFEDNNLFSRRFKQSLNISPSKYRQLNKTT